MDAGRLGPSDHLVSGRALAAIGDVVADRVVEQHRVLGHDADRRTQAGLRHSAYILAVDFHHAASDVIEPEDQPEDSRLACSRRPDHRQAAPARHLERDIAQSRAVLPIVEIHIAEGHAPLGYD